MKTLTFYSHCNFGDIHISRAFVKHFVETLKPERAVYHHRNSNRLLLDIPQLEHADMLSRFNSSVPGFRLGDDVYLNTWYAVSPVWREGRGFGCTLNTLYELFCKHATEFLDTKIRESIESFIPRIDFSRYAIDPARDFLDRTEGFKRVLISNGEPRSCQTRMPRGVFDQLIGDVIRAHPEAIFFLSDLDERPRTASNVVYTRNVTKIPLDQCDLPENGYISTRCDVVIGRASGAYSFAYLADNFLNPKKRMVCFTDDERTARWIYPTNIVKARIQWSNDYGLSDMRDVVEEALR